jgi:HEAT repeat protein
MNQPEAGMARAGALGDSDAGPPAIASVIADLGSRDGQARVRARECLVAIGEPAVGPLVAALTDPRESVRREAARILDWINVNWEAHADPATMSALVADLGSGDGLVRVRARKCLVAIESRAVGSLIEALTNPKEVVRWEAAKALGQIRDPAAAQALVGALEDEMFDVRWLAAEGLGAIGCKALVPLLEALSRHPDSVWVRGGAHHVLCKLAAKCLEDVWRPVLAALENVEPLVEVPFAATAALDRLKTAEGQHEGC